MTPPLGPRGHTQAGHAAIKRSRRRCHLHTPTPNGEGSGLDVEAVKDLHELHKDGDRLALGQNVRNVSSPRDVLQLIHAASAEVTQKVGSRLEPGSGTEAS